MPERTESVGGGLPAEAGRQLRLAGLAYRDDGVAERHLRRALDAAPGHAAVLIAMYRFYFYKGRLAEASEAACACLEWGARACGLAADWRCVRSADADFGSYDSALARFYLFALKAYAYLQMRLGELAMGHAAAAKLLELDPNDKLGGKTLLRVLERRGRDDDD